MSIWPFTQIRDWWQWRTRDRQEITVATAKFVTEFVNSDRVKTGRTATHILAFYVDGNGVRYGRIESSDADAAKRHESLIECRSNWKHHGVLPDYAQRVIKKGGANLVLLNGGNAA